MREENEAVLPINTRVIGTPMGEIALYLEDYVYTFMKRLVHTDSPQESQRKIQVSLWGKIIQTQKGTAYMISGAAEQEQVERLKEKFFRTCDYLGEALLQEGKLNDISIAVLGRENIQLEDFYIYYDQNEEMQNYMIEWNMLHTKHRLVEVDEAVRYSKIAQAYNKEEVKVGFLWNVMNVLSLSFIVCVMVYGIVSINHYYKMKALEEDIYRVRELIDQQDILTWSESLQQDLLGVSQTEQETTVVIQTGQAEESQSEVSADGNENDLTGNAAGEEEAATVVEESAIEEIGTVETAGQETGLQEAVIEETKIEEAQEIVSQAVVSSGESVTAADGQQYYIVQPGDTLRSISLSRYGSYDKVEEICQKNQITDPDSILYGQKLVLP